MKQRKANTRRLTQLALLLALVLIKIGRASCRERV